MNNPTPTRTGIRSSDPGLLKRAAQAADEYAELLIRSGVTGIAFLGALVRGYFDHHADIDIAVFTGNRGEVPAVPQYQQLRGFEVHCHVASLDEEASSPWDMPKRWAFSESRVVHDPEGRVAKLLEEKVPLKPEERRWLLISGITLSEWYINRLTSLWIDRGSLISAHGMFNEGLNHFYDMLFSLNNRLVADHKWRYYYAERLAVLPSDFGTRIADVMMLHAMDEPEIRRRQSAFMHMWRQMVPLVEKEVSMRYEEFKDTV